MTRVVSMFRLVMRRGREVNPESAKNVQQPHPHNHIHTFVSFFSLVPLTSHHYLRLHLCE
jgi:hypothetical protein